MRTQDELGCILLITNRMSECPPFCLAGAPCKLYSLQEFSGYADWFSRVYAKIGGMIYCCPVIVSVVHEGIGITLATLRRDLEVAIAPTYRALDIRRGSFVAHN